MKTPKPEYRGMTLNERLGEAGLHEEFDRAIRAKNRELVKNLLIQVGFTENEADSWVIFGMEIAYWQRVLPEKLREHKVKRKFEDAVRTANADSVQGIMIQMGASKKTAKDMLPQLLAFYFYNYTSMKQKESFTMKAIASLAERLGGRRAVRKSR